MHDRHERGVISQRLLQFVRRHDAARVDWQQRGPPAATSQRLYRVEHRLVLDGACNEVLASGDLERLGSSSNGDVVAFGAAAREHDLGRIGAEQRGHAAPCLIQRSLGPLSEVMTHNTT